MHKVSIEGASVVSSGLCPRIAHSGPMHDIAFFINGHLVIERIGDEAICFICSDVGIYHKKAVANRRLNGRVKLQTMQGIFSYTRVKVKLNSLCTHPVGYQL